MKRYISLVAIISLVLIFQGTLLAQNTTEKTNASMDFEEDFYDFGEVSSDTVLTHVFKFENSGTDTLFIGSVRGSWGCTASLLSSEVIPPGDTGQLEVSFSTKNRFGKNRKTVYIYSNDKNSQVKKIYVKAKIVRKTTTS